MRKGCITFQNDDAYYCLVLINIVFTLRRLSFSSVTPWSCFSRVFIILEESSRSFRATLASSNCCCSRWPETQTHQCLSCKIRSKCDQICCRFLSISYLRSAFSGCLSHSSGFWSPPLWWQQVAEWNCCAAEPAPSGWTLRRHREEGYHVEDAENMKRRLLLIYAYIIHKI